MATLVTETGGNWSTATWYRTERRQLLFATHYSAASAQFTTSHAGDTFDNAGNLRGVVVAVGGTTSYAVPVGRYLSVGIQKGPTFTVTIASPAVVTQTGHGFTGARSGVTISYATPTVITYTSHGLKEGDYVGFTTSGSLPSGITAGSTYYVRYLTADTFNISATQKGALIATGSAGSGTHSMHVERVTLTTSGALPTGLTATSTYWVKYIDADTYNLSSTAGGTNINTSGTQSGTNKAWHTKEFAFVTTEDIVGTGQTYFSASTYFVPVLFSGTTAVDTTAGGWRFTFVQTDGSGNNLLVKGVSNQIGVIAWCDTTVAWNSGDVPIICAPITYDTSTTFTGVAQVYLGEATDVTTSFAGLICSPAKGNRAYSSSGAGNAMFKWDGSASRTLTVDGSVVCGTHTGIYIGTEDSPITYANKAVLTFTSTPTYSGSTALYSGFHDAECASNYYAGGMTFVACGAYPTQRYATLVSNAVTGQKDLVVDDASGFASNDYVYVSKNNAVYASGINATRYQISSVAGNTITLTANLSGENRLAGGYVIPVESSGSTRSVNGYGVQIYSSSLSAGVSFFRNHGCSNLYMKGVHVRGGYLQLGYSTSYRFVDNTANLRAWYVGYCCFESYQNAQSTSTGLIAIYSNELGGTIEYCLSIMCAGFGSVNNQTLAPAAGVVKKCGPIAFSNCFFMRSSVSHLSGGGFGKTGSSYTNITIHNSIYGILPGQDNTYSNFTLYGCATTIYAYSSYFSTIDTLTSDVTTTAFTLASTGYNFLGCEWRDLTITNISGYSFVPTADCYFDLNLINAGFDMTDIDTTSQADISAGSEVRVTNNNGVANDDLVISPNGYKRRCGSGLTDTTVYASNSYSWRIQPTNQPTLETFNYDQIIGDQNGYDMFVYMWIKINSANYYAGTHRLPRLYVTYDQTSQSYSQAAESTAWQQLIVPFKPATTYPSITIELNGYTDATGTDSYFYLGQIGTVLPAGRNVDPGALDYWANAKPLTAIPSGLSAADVWAVPTSQLTGSGTIGKRASSALTLAQFIGLK